MKLRARISAVLAFGLVATIGGVALGATADGGPATRNSVAYFAGGTRASSSMDPSPTLYETKFHSGEPTIGVDKKGDVFVTAEDVTSQPIPSQIDVLRSSDGGKSWVATNPAVGPQKTHPTTLDPYVFVDNLAGAHRVFTIDATAACAIASYSDDEGATWMTNPIACDEPITDHQTLFSGPAVGSTPVGYPNLVYYCYNDTITASCAKSLDGGTTWVRTGTPAFVAFKGTTFCNNGLTGHGVAGADGTIYLPRNQCGQPELAISHDEGATWAQIDVTGGKMKHVTGPDPAVAVDSKGNVYYVFIADKDRLPYLVVSHDEGKTWGKPLRIGPPGLKESDLPSIAVGSPGKIAIAFVGSENSPGAPFSASYADVTWNGYVTTSTTALGTKPLFYSTIVNPKSDPIFRGHCGPGRCGSILDFIDVTVAPDGTPWASFVDACTGDCTKPGADKPVGDFGVVAKIGGISLR
ncbi:MAG: glycoside hydrolase [Actinomycetota bacterium]|nr:glycoside hydrolase [Actinomycetota bacterium]